MGANFYYALGQRELENTVYEYQPAVTTMWIVTAAMLLYYPEYRGLGQGYLEFEKGVLDPFLLEHGKDPLVLLQIARLLQVLVIVILLLASFYLLRRLVGTGLALASILLVSLDPFFLGHSRLLDHEAMLAGFILISLLALTLYVFEERRPVFLVLSAVAAALAQLTKSSGIALLVPVGLMLLIHVLRNSTQLRATLLDSARIFGIWLGVLLLSYVLFWPGMWVAPGKMLYQVYGNAFSYAFQGARLIALDGAESQPAGLDLGLDSFSQLAGTLLWHTTTITWTGLLLAIILLLNRRGWQMTEKTRLAAWLVGAAGLAFVVMFALAQGRNSPHYLLTRFLMFNLLAGIGWLTSLRMLLPEDRRRLAGWAMAGVLLIQAASVFISYYPYYFTYQNRLLSLLQPRSAPLFAYGEGLELAGEFLAAQPDSANAVSLAYYSRGCFSYFFPGRSERFKPYYAEPGHQQELKDALAKADYLVLYPAIQRGQPKYARLFEALKGVSPLKEIRLNGYQYVLIYRVEALPPSFHEKLFP
jgi:4-amino-4-deoxy-L-arabinose transferase-like glycosyltransferase